MQASGKWVDQGVTTGAPAANKASMSRSSKRRMGAGEHARATHARSQGGLLRRCHSAGQAVLREGAAAVRLMLPPSSPALRHTCTTPPHTPASAAH